MLNLLLNKILMDKAKDDAGGGGGIPVPPKSEAKPQAEPPKVDNPPQEAGDIEYDELGYEKPKVQAESGKQKAKEDPKPEEEKPLEPITGYDKKPEAPKEDIKPDDKKPDDPKPSAEDEEFKELNFETLLPEEAKQLKEFAKKHKLSKEVAQDLIDSKKAEIKAINDALKKQKEETPKILAQRKAERENKWYEELKADPTFGGDKFDHNIKQVTKVVQEFMPNTKKVLTDNKMMMPPYVMRDLVKLAEHLYSSDRLNQGDPPKPPETNESDDPLDFYK